MRNTPHQACEVSSTMVSGVKLITNCNNLIIETSKDLTKKKDESISVKGQR